MKVGAWFAAVLLAAAPAAAQTPPDEGGAPPPNPNPTPPPPPPTPPPPPHAEPTAPMMAEPAGDMPSELAVGIGIGYVFPTSLETPNIATVRVRLPNRITIEPGLVLTSSSTKTDDGMGNAPETKTSEVGLSATVRYPIVTHHRFELELVGGLRADRTSTTPPTADMNTTTTTVDLDWGLAVGYWFSRHFQLSLTAANPLVTHTSTAQEMGPNLTETTTTTTFGLVFDPTIELMFHVYH